MLSSSDEFVPQLHDELTQPHDELSPIRDKFVTKINIFEKSTENLRGIFSMITLSDLVPKSVI